MHYYLKQIQVQIFYGNQELSSFTWYYFTLIGDVQREKAWHLEGSMVS